MARHRWAYDADRHVFACQNPSCPMELTADFLDVQPCGVVHMKMTHDGKQFIVVAMHVPIEGSQTQGVGGTPGEAVGAIASQLRKRMKVPLKH